MTQLNSELEMSICKGLVVILAVLLGLRISWLLLAIENGRALLIFVNASLICSDLYLTIGCLKLIARGVKEE